MPAPPGKKPKAGQDPRPTTSAAVKSACKLKAGYESATAKANSLKAAIETNSAWAWAKSSTDFVALVEGLGELQANMSTFGLEFLCKEFKDVKSAYTATVFEAECTRLVETLSPLLKKIETETRSLLVMQQARQKVHR